MGLYSPITYQSKIEAYRYPLLSVSRNEIEELADLNEDSEDEQAIARLIDNIRNGEYSDLLTPSPDGAPSHLRVNPAYYGIHINSIEGETTNFDLTLPMLANDSGTRFRSSRMKNIPVSGLTMMSAGLPGQYREDGRRVKWSSSCGISLNHGDIKASKDKETVFRVKEQFLHCDCKKCGNCLRYNSYVQAREPSERIMSYRDKLAREGYTPVIYQVVLSPPQRHKDPLAYERWLSLEGYEDMKKAAIIILKMLGSFGGQLITHHFRENGEDGRENGDITGNDGDPKHWRLALHFHAIAIFDFMAPLDKVAEIYRETGWTVKFPTHKKNKKDRGDIKEARLKTLADVQKKMFYLLSHESIMETDDGRTVRGSTPFGGLTHRRFRAIWGPNRGPLYKEGYTETDDDGRVLYWYDDLLRFVPLGLDNLAEVERVNSAFVYCDARHYRECMGVIIDLCARLGIPLRYERAKRTDRRTGSVTFVQRCIGPAEDIPPAELYRAIAHDDRFYSTFEPVASPETMRPPRRDMVDGLDLWMFRKEAEDNGQCDASREYIEACAEADRREAEYLKDKEAALIRHRREAV